MFNRLDFIAKITGMYIDCTLTVSFTIFSDLPLTPMTPLSIIVVTLVLSRPGQPMLSSWLGRCATRKAMYCQYGVHHQRIISNVILLLSPSSILNSNELQRQSPTSLFNDILHYSNVCTELRLTFQCFHVCFRLLHSGWFAR